MTNIGPAFDPDADEAESDLDTQYMAMMGPGVPVCVVGVIRPALLLFTRYLFSDVMLA